MGLGDLFKANENAQLKARITELEAQITPEMKDAASAAAKLEGLKNEIAFNERKIQDLHIALEEIEAEISQAKKSLIETNDAVLMQEFGLYEPHYSFSTSEEYKYRLTQVRDSQKNLVRNKRAATGFTDWTVNNSAAKGRKMVADMQKLLIRAFNSECDEIIDKIKFNNIESGLKRISSSQEAISRLGSIMGVSITPDYYNLKIEELYLAYEYQLKKQEEKEEQRRQREQLREQAKLQKEIEEARRKISKDRQHYENALKQAQDRLEKESDEAKRNDLLEKIEVFQKQLNNLEEELKSVDYREANQRAGYVYIISNIGAFGENVYKIGMTRRLDPLDRIDELGDASVPFRFDVHAIIFADDAPKLEAALHHAFEDRRVNLVNNRREFFRVTLDEIKEVVRNNFDKTVDFVDVPEAEQYRQSLLMV